MNTLKICFGKRLKNIRKNKHYTQEQLAEKIDINLRQLARIEAGESFITAETLQKICKTLDVPPDSLFKFTLDENTQNIEFKNLINKLELISEDINKIEFINTAIEAIEDKAALERLKILIKGLELKT